MKNLNFSKKNRNFPGRVKKRKLAKKNKSCLNTD